MNKIGRRLTAVLASGLISSAALAGDRSREQTNGSFPAPGDSRFHFYADLGAFDAVGGASYLADPDMGTLLGVGFGWNFRRHFGLETEMFLASEEHRLPRPDPELFESRPSLVVSTLGVLTRLKAGRDFGRVRPSVGIGLGIGLGELSVQEGLSVADPLESEFALITAWDAGLEFRVGERSSLGLELRWIETHADIEFAGERVDAGGEAVAMTYRYRIGSGRAAGHGR